jgi:hypothetical protein
MNKKNEGWEEDEEMKRKKKGLSNMRNKYIRLK